MVPDFVKIRFHGVVELLRVCNLVVLNEMQILFAWDAAMPQLAGDNSVNRALGLTSEFVHFVLGIVVESLLILSVGGALANLLLLNVKVPDDDVFHSVELLFDDDLV